MFTMFSYTMTTYVLEHIQPTLSVIYYLYSLAWLLAVMCTVHVEHTHYLTLSVTSRCYMVGSILASTVSATVNAYQSGWLVVLYYYLLYCEPTMYTQQ